MMVLITSLGALKISLGSALKAITSLTGRRSHCHDPAGSTNVSHRICRRVVVFVHKRRLDPVLFSLHATDHERQCAAVDSTDAADFTVVHETRSRARCLPENLSTCRTPAIVPACISQAEQNRSQVRLSNVALWIRHDRTKVIPRAMRLFGRASMFAPHAPDTLRWTYTATTAADMATHSCDDVRKYVYNVVYWWS